jgi:hypothetical protein
VGGVELTENALRICAQRRGQRRVELRAGAPLGELERGVDASNPVRDLDELGELRQPRREGDAIPGQAARPALPVPLLVGGPDRLLNFLRQTEPLRQRARDRRMLEVLERD